MTLRKLTRGIDFLGYVVLPHHRVLRTRTKRRMLRRVTEENLPSYCGLLAHCNGDTLATRATAIATSSENFPLDEWNGESGKFDGPSY